MIATHPRYQYFARRYDLQITSLEWEAGATPTAEELSDLSALIANTGAEVLIWEAAPTDEAMAATAALGLRNVVFDPMARGGAEASFIAAFGAAVEAIAEAAAGSPGN